MKKIDLWLFMTLLSMAHCYAAEVVGRIAGSLGVNEMGGATYSIPINLLQAANEYTPSISLVYNSQAGNSLAGYGWNLSGFSSITMGPRNVYFDEIADGVHEGRDNAYYLDGMRLLLVSGENGKQGAIYRTESERYSIISIDSVMAETPATFTVKTVDGSIYRYGSLATGRMQYSADACYEWALDYAEDQQGNYITYSYYLDAFTLYPASITYGRNKYNNSTPLYSLSFIYSPRPDKIPVHRFETSASFGQLLTRIVCKSQNLIYKRYELAYDVNVYSHLTSVQEFGLQSESYPATTFVWQDIPSYDLGQKSPSVPHALSQSVDDTYYFSTDVDNDGKSELVGLYSSFTGFAPYTAMQVWKHDRLTSNFQQDDSYITQAGLSIPGMYSSLRYGGVVAHLSRRPDNTVLLPYLMNLNGAAMRFQCMKEDASIDFPLRSSANNVCYTLADVDKNGIDEIILIEQAQITGGGYPATILRPDLSQSGSNLPHTNFTMNLAGVPKRIVPADYDGDGMTDLLVSTTNGYYIYWNCAGEYSDDERFYGTDFNECDVLEVGDLNGDGLPDLIINKKNSVSWYNAVNQGQKSSLFTFYEISELVSLGACNNSNGNEAYCLVQDFDGDGRSDLLVGMSFYTTNKHFISAQMVLLKSLGGLFEIIDSSVFPSQACFPTLSRIVQGDFDGNGVTEIMYYGGDFRSTSTDVAWHILEPCGYTPASNRIISVSDGLGNIQEIEYGLLSDPELYVRTSTSTFPLLTLQTTMPVTSRIKATTGNDSLWSAYTYKNAIYHWQGKGFLGFKEKTINTSAGTKSVICNAVNENYYVLYNTSEEIYDNHQGLWKQHNRYTNFYSIGPKCYFECCNGDASQNHKGPEFEYYGWQFHDHGIPTFEEYTAPVNNTETELTFWDSIPSGKYVKNLPVRIETAKEQGTEHEEVTERTDYTRDNTTGLPLMCKKYRNNTLLETTLYTYNTKRQLICQTVMYGDSSDSLTTTYTYGSNGRISQVTDPIGHTTQYFYNTYGRLIRERDYLGINTYYTYDGMMREKKRYNTISSIERTYATGDYGNAAYKMVEKVKGKPTYTTYYDAWDRKIAEAEQRFDGKWLYTDYKYLENGQIGFVSFPHTSASVSSDGTYNTYDTYARLITQTDSNGKTSTWTYNNAYTVTSTIGGVTRRMEYAGPGLVEYITDDSGYVIFESGADGRPVEILLNGEYETQVEYDDHGHISQTTDMQGVTRSYTYDLNGYPQAVIQGTSTHNTQYDKYGRLLSQTYHDAGTLSTPQFYYTYNSYNQLVCDSSNNHVYNYEYDAYGRLKVESRKVVANEVESMTNTYTYNGNNQISQKTIVLEPIGVTLVEKYTYANGWCTSISLNDTLVWQLKEENGIGQTQKVDNHMDTQLWAHDVYGHLLSQEIHGLHNLSQLYSYNTITGNLTQKDDESYAYDNLSRLAGWNNITYSYDNLGNLLSMVPLDTMTYDDFKLISLISAGTMASTSTSILNYYKSMERPNSITENHKRLVYGYDGSKRRVWMKTFDLLTHPNTLKGIRYYVSDNYEIDKQDGIYERHYYYVGGTPYDAPAVVLIEDSVPVIYQIYRDHLGSIVMYASQDETIRQTFHPWGARYRIRNGNKYYVPSGGYDGTTDKFFRTYTGHEEIPYVGLLNTNARLYSPYLGRFYSPDPILTTKGNPLDFNPYVYARNNPMSYVDTDGEMPHIVAAMLIGATVGGILNLADNWGDINSLGDGFLYFAMGAGAGAASMAIGSISLGIGGVAGGALSGALGGSVSGFMLGTGNAAISGEDIWKSGLSSTWKGALFGAAFGGILGGYDAYTNNQNIWTGARKPSLPSDIGSNLLKKDENILFNETNDPTGFIPEDTPQQIHHFATNKNKIYTPQMEQIVDEYGLNLNESWNRELLPHSGRHPNIYHEFVLDGMKNASIKANGNKDLFLQLFELNVKQPIRSNPNMLYKNWWRNNPNTIYIYK